MTDTATILNAPMTRAGVPLPLGAYERCGGLNLAVFSRHATQVTGVVT